MTSEPGITAEEAMERLRIGNAEYVRSGRYGGDVSAEARMRNAKSQHPYAVIVSCSDSREIPEAIFSAGTGDLFVIRTAGNTVGSETAGSAEYAVEHLGCRLIVVMGHTGCGAVAAALGEPEGGLVEGILEDVRRAIGGERNPARASELNAMRSAEVLADALDGLAAEVVPAIYDIGSGEVRFLGGEEQDV